MFGEINDFDSEDGEMTRTLVRAKMLLKDTKLYLVHEPLSEQVCKQPRIDRHVQLS